MTRSPPPAGPAVAPVVSQDPDRPFWSVMIPARDCADTIERTLESVLESAEESAAMQIEVVDDCSADDLRSVIQRIGEGRIAYGRHPTPRGAPRTFNSCVERARGRWVHLLHADDVVRPDFYGALRRAIEAHPSAGAALCRCVTVDEDDRRLEVSGLERRSAGLAAGFAHRLALGNHVRAPSIAVSRQAYERLGGFKPELGHAADWEMWLRVGAAYPVVYEPTLLACYRRHPGSDTRRLMRSGADIADAARAVREISGVLGASGHDVSRDALSALARRAIGAARSLLRAGEVDAARVQLREALACGQDVYFLRGAVKVLAETDRIGMRTSEGSTASIPLWRFAREQAASLLLATPPERLEWDYLRSFRPLLSDLGRGGLRDQALLPGEHELLERLLASIQTEPSSPRLASRVLTTGLYALSMTGDFAWGAACVPRPAGPRPTLAGAGPGHAPPTPSRSRARRRPAVALAVGAYHPTIRGDGLHVRAIAEALRERGYAPIVLAPRGPNDPARVDGIPVASGASHVRACDALITYGVSEMTRACAAEATAARTPRPAWIHHPCSTAAGDLAERADLILAFSSWDLCVARTAGRSRGDVIRLHPAVPPSRRGRPGDFRARFAIDDPYILWVGGWIPEKGARALSERFVLFLNRHPGACIRLVMFGGYGEREYPLPHPRITKISGNVTDVPAAIADCLFVAFNSPPPPLGYEATPLVLLEGLLHGKTFVAQDSAPLLEDIGHLGVVVRTDEEWLDAVATLTFEPERRRALEALCEATHGERYIFDRMINGLDHALTDLLGMPIVVA